MDSSIRSGSSPSVLLPFTSTVTALLLLPVKCRLLLVSFHVLLRDCSLVRIRWARERIDQEIWRGRVSLGVHLKQNLEWRKGWDRISKVYVTSVWECGLASCGWRRGTVAGCCEEGNESPGSIPGDEFLDEQRYYNSKKLRGLSPHANYTDRAAAAGRRSWCQLLRIEGCHVVSATGPHSR